MCRYLFIVLLGLLAASPAAAQKRGGLQEFNGQVKQDQTAEELKAARRKAAGVTDIKDFGINKEPPPKPIPWVAIGLAVLCLGAAAPFGWKMYKSTRGDLEDGSTFGMGKGRREVAPGETAGALPNSGGISRRPPSRQKKADGPQQPANSDAARDAVWDALSGAGSNWVTADWVANKSGVPASQASEEIGSLLSEGHVQEARDSRGKPVFRLAGEGQA